MVSFSATTMAKMMLAAVVPLKETGLMDLVGPERTITEEVTLLHTPGHAASFDRAAGRRYQTPHWTPACCL